MVTLSWTKRRWNPASPKATTGSLLSFVCVSAAFPAQLQPDSTQDSMDGSIFDPGVSEPKSAPALKRGLFPVLPLPLVPTKASENSQPDSICS